MYTLYSIAGTCSTGITVLLEKLGVDYKVIQRVDVEDYRAISPTNAVPALQLDDGQVITEGAAIVLYLLEKHGGNLLPENAEDRARFYEGLLFNYATLHPAYSKMFTVQFKVDISDAEKAKLLPQLVDQLSALWAILDKRLEKQSFLFGDTPTVLDYLVAIYASWNNRFPGVDIKLGDNVKELIKVITALPEFKAAFARENVEYKAAA